MIGRAAQAILRRLEGAAARHETQILRLALKSVGSGGTLGVGLRVSDPSKVMLGDNVHIGRNGWIKSEGGLRVGSNTHISRNVVVYTVNHDYRGTRLPYDDHLIEEGVEIGESVWIGMNVCVAPGTVIGDGAIVAMGAVVSGIVPPLGIVGSAKWRELGRRDEEHYWRLSREGQFGGPDGTALRE